MIENKEINRTFEKYPTYKDSGVEWLGEIPSHWEIKKMKFLGSIFPGLSGKKGDDFSKEFREDFKPFIPFTNICNNLKIDTDQYQYVHIAELEVQNKVQKNDILFLMSSETLEDIGKCSLYDGKNKELYLNSFCKGFRLNSNKLSTYFVNYLLQGQIYRNYFSLVGRGFTRINLKQEYINDAPIVLPLLQEQNTIANFLDNKTSKIDTAIAQKEQMIALLKERKQIIIQNAVTKGLDPNAKMKDSGVEWIGEIPEEWEVKKLKHISKIIDCKNRTPEYFDSGEYFVVRTSNVKSGVLINEQRLYTDKKNFQIWTERGVPIINSVLFTREAPAGEACLVPNDVPLCLGQRMMSIRGFTKQLNNQFLLYQIYSPVIQIYISLVSSGSTVTHLRVPQVFDMQIICPSIQEQIEIVFYLETQSTKIDQTITLQQSQIDKLKEYKATLIDGAVTGKIRVSG